MAKRAAPSVEVMEADDGRWMVTVVFATADEAWNFANSVRSGERGGPRLVPLPAPKAPSEK